MNRCKECSKEINSHKKFCNSSCSATFNNKTRIKKVYAKCICGKQLSRIDRMFCSVTCQQELAYQDWVKSYTLDNSVATLPTGKTSKRIWRFVSERDGYKCNTCKIVEWNGSKLVFELEHIDGNSENNSEDNLELTCPNCHSQTDTYKAKNKGNGRHYRRQRYADGKSY